MSEDANGPDASFASTTPSTPPPGSWDHFSGSGAPGAPGVPGPPPPPWASARPAPAPGGGAPGRHRTRIVVGIAAVVAVVAATAVSLAVTGGSRSAPTASPVARRLARLALASAARASSFHYVSRYASGGDVEITIGDAGPSSGRQNITIGSDSFTVLVIGSACYFRGDAAEMSAQLGLPAAAALAHANQWISLVPSDGPYPSVSVAVTASSALTSNIAFKAERQSQASTLSGRRVVILTGPMTDVTLNGQVQRARGIATLSVDTTRKHLPVRYTENGTVQGSKGKFSMTFGRWGEQVDLQAPLGAVPYSSLGPSRTTPQSPPVFT